ncbi:MAG: hypothetical protein ACI9B9_000038 [Halioglobus sp.]|jgi:hypothetical protein
MGCTYKVRDAFWRESVVSNVHHAFLYCAYYYFGSHFFRYNFFSFFKTLPDELFVYRILQALKTIYIAVSDFSVENF